MGDPTKGLYQKFTVSRTDGSSFDNGKHAKCSYFVLDLTHDKHAPAALLAYADSCEAEYPALAQDLRAVAASRMPGQMASEIIAMADS